MKNQEVARILYDMADLLEIHGEMVFKVRAYRRAAQSIESMANDIEETPLETIPGVGKGIAEKITEYLKTGKVKYLDDLKKNLPTGFSELLQIEGIGPKKVKLLYEKLKIKNTADLEKACREGKLRKIKSLGEKTEQNILKNIQAAAGGSGVRMLLAYALPIADRIIDEMKKCPQVEKIDAAGSLRRMKETIGDLDILVMAKKADPVVEHFTKMSNVADVTARGPTKASVKLLNGLQVDLRVLPEKEYGSALMYFTGSKQHNIELRKIAIAKKLKLSEYGLFSGNRQIAGKTEEEVYNKLGLSYIEPEMREVHGETELARQGKLPRLIGYADIKGDLQMHTKWSDGANTAQEMAQAAARMGYEYICITDHVGHLAIANALDPKRLEKQRIEIEKLNKKSDIRVLHGGEIDIRLDGKFDVDNKVLKSLDIVLASLHSGLKADRTTNTNRILSAMENPHVDIIAHPSGRLINRRDGASLDIEKITDKAKETGTILEIDAQPDRLDLNDANAWTALKKGCLISIDTDAHSTAELRNMRIGIGTARRAWARKEDVINTRPLDKMLKCLKQS